MSIFSIAVMILWALSSGENNNLGREESLGRNRRGLTLDNQSIFRITWNFLLKYRFSTLGILLQSVWSRSSSNPPVIMVLL